MILGTFLEKNTRPDSENMSIYRYKSSNTLYCVTRIEIDICFENSLQITDFASELQENLEEMFLCH